ncbi:putative drug resistance protein [Gordonia polyisoprenivorans NBRC 16320 = JCM 10675]|uniref:MFS transporter n=1 Tax=Gordonia polyisoprenivorans TaxID=84595 RepID=A0A846WDV8_9ACTN|nr:MFS transporter [Gordonia polyisoprenivorans]NKY00015.1 MFS transporter [Gordonia polyisoprenivorans]GAB25635.1 putative drug resistance protein [Gordonia polyisoprenivorans NBRC 16320 = JCM 10675]
MLSHVSPEPSTTISPRRRTLAMAVLIGASFMDLFDVTIMQVALPSIRNDLHADAAQLEWIIAGYMLAFASMLITGGRLGDAIGRRRAFLIGVAGFTLASLAGACSPDADLLIVARVAQGLFAAVMVPQGLSTLQALYRPRERARVYGMFGAISGMAAVAGPILGGVLVSGDVAGLGWRSVLLINVPVGIVLLVLGRAYIPDTRDTEPADRDLIAVALSAGGVVAVLYPIVEGHTLGWPAWSWAVMAGGVVLLALFVVRQRAVARAGRAPLLPGRLFANRGFSVGLVVQTVFQGSMNIVTLTLMLYVQSTLGYSALKAGMTILAFALGAFAGFAIAGPFARFGRHLMFVGALLQSTGTFVTLLIVLHEGAALTPWDIVAPLAVMGAGLSMLVMPLVEVALALVPVRWAGAASGVFATFQQLGAAVGIAVAGTTYFAVLGTDLAVPHAAHAFAVTAALGAAGYLIAAFASLALPNREQVLAHEEAVRAAIEAEEEGLSAI